VPVRDMPQISWVQDYERFYTMNVLYYEGFYTNASQHRGCIKVCILHCMAPPRLTILCSRSMSFKSKARSSVTLSTPGSNALAMVPRQSQ